MVYFSDLDGHIWRYLEVLKMLFYFI